MISYSQERLARYVREYRDKEGLSQRALAARCNGMPSLSTISRIENMQAKSFPGMDTLVRLLNVIDITLDQIINADTPEEKAQIDDISAQLRASKTVSPETLQALAAIIQAVQTQTVSSEGA